MKVLSRGVYFRSGFTLVEVMFVVILLAFISAVSMVSLNSMSKRAELKNAANELFFMMRYAQSRATTNSRTIRLEFDDNYSRYWLTEGGDLKQNSGYERFSGKFGQTIRVSEDVSVISEGDQIYFHPNGTIDKKYIYVCPAEDDEQDCFTVSSKHQRGVLHLFNQKIDQ